MVGRNLSSDNKTIPRYDDQFNFSDIHPCTYQYLVADETNPRSSPIFEVVEYAEKNDIHYEEALKESIQATESTGRQGKLPEVRGSSKRLAQRLQDADRMVAGSAGGFIPKSDLKSIRRAAISTHQKEEYKFVCAQLAPLFVGRKAPVSISDVKSLSDDEIETVADAVKLPPDKLGYDPQEDDSDSTRDEMELEQDMEDAEEKDDQTIVQTRDVWGSDNDFAVWMYAKLINRDNIAQQLAQGGDPESLSVYSNLRKLLEQSSDENMLGRRISDDNVVQLTPEQDAKWDQVKQIVSGYSDDDKSLAALVNQMSRLEIVVDEDSPGGSDARIIDPGVEDDSPIPDDYDFDPSDSPQDVPSALQAEMEN